MAASTRVSARVVVAAVLLTGLALVPVISSLIPGGYAGLKIPYSTVTVSAVELISSIWLLK